MQSPSIEIISGEQAKPVELMAVSKCSHESALWEVERCDSRKTTARLASTHQCVALMLIRVPGHVVIRRSKGTKPLA